ncbi:hypothetical protein BuS5_03722 [Desulfosarcina sp. BuS5]|uniref:hypothetical protein n=1 Tax=Desulfosarcina sp. BuS5 TaxID=933262 RepID=UPI0023784557|nr:hypothetical protein [Desulfosarcina sp. BuS5]WDN90751.1 hypothetical protein BuS5_03722 [Desulfosarcina sp. BuS5]
MKSNVYGFVVPLILGAYFVMGMFVYADYGISWDEPVSRMNGLVNCKYVGQKVGSFLLTKEVRNAPNLKDWMDKDYGVAFEMPLVALEQVLSISEQEIYYFRHLLTFIQ